MNKQSVNIKTSHEIQLVDEPEIDYITHTGQGEWLQLNSYYKVQYRGEDGASVSLKWFPEEKHRLILTQSKSQFIFNLTEKTTQWYTMPYGELPLELETVTLDHKELDNGGQWFVRYRLLNNGQLLGNYKYELIYTT